MEKSKSKMKKWSLIVLTLAIVFCSAGVTPITAASPDLIKVALFIDNGNAYRNTIPTVTLTSQTGLQIGIANKTIEEISSYTSARFSVDQFFIQLETTEDITKAQQIAQQLSQANYKAEILVTFQKGKKVYVVRTGSYSQLTDANIELSKIKNLGLSATVRGSFRLSAGLFPSKQEAETRISEINNHGFTSYIVVRTNGTGQTEYEVLAGDEATPDERNILKQNINNVLPALALTDANIAGPYVLLKDDIIIGSVNETLPHMFFPDGQIVTVAPRGQTYVKVEERSGREYRGTFELMNHKGKMAVINVVDIEQYLYAVVGAEMSTGWALEALKAQSVAARSYLWAGGIKYGIAHVSDTTFDQAYYGVKNEATDIITAVNETKGMVVKYNGKILSPLYHSNAGGLTANNIEVFGTDLPYYIPTTSPDDNPNRSAAKWYAVVSKLGQFGYVHSDYINKTGRKNETGHEFGVVVVDGETLNFRSAPRTDQPNIGSFANGEELLIVNTVSQNNSFQFITRPITGLELAESIRKSDPTFLDPTVTKLEIGTRGPSGRVITVTVNDKSINVSKDRLRGALGGATSLPSTMFTIESRGALPVLGAGGKNSTLPQSTISVLGANGMKTTVANDNTSYFVMDSKKIIKDATLSPSFRFHVKGFGHGLGMSQWGAKAMAEQGYDYKQILKHYYTNGIEIGAR